MDQQSQTIIVAILTGLAIWLIKQFLQQFFTTRTDVIYGEMITIKTKLEEHLDKCDEIPKAQIMTAIEGLSNEIVNHGKDIRELRDMTNRLLLKRS